MSSASYDVLVDKSDKKGKGDKKADKGDVGKEKERWPKELMVKSTKNTLEGAIASAYRLENASDPAYSSNKKWGYFIHIALGLMVFLIQGFIVAIFNASTASALQNRYAPAPTQALANQIHTLVERNNKLPPGVPLGTLGPLQAPTCNLQRSHPTLGYIMMFMWFSMMSKEVYDCIGLITTIITLPEVKTKEEKEEDPMKKPKPLPDSSCLWMGKDKDKIDHMQFQWKIWILAFLLIPQLALFFYITWVGVGFLAVTGDPPALILKAMTLKFILGFGKMFYFAFTSDQFVKYHKVLKYKLKREPRRNYWHSWIASVLKLGVSIALSGLSWSQYTHMMVLRASCRAYNDQQTSICLGGNSCGFHFLNKLGLNW